MTPITQFRNRKVVHYETYDDYIIIVTQREPKLLGFYKDYYSTYICNTSLQVLRQNIHDDSVTFAYLVDNAKAEINPFEI